MNRFEKRKLKRNIYKHGNTIMYIAIFIMASVITMAAAANRTDKIAYVDDAQMSSTAKESVDIKNSTNPKVASTETNTEETTTETVADNETTEHVSEAENVSGIENTEPETTQSTAVSKVRITADSLNVRSEASTDSEPIGSAVMNQEYEVISQSGDWVEIKFNGESGFIHSEFAEIVE